MPSALKAIVPGMSGTIVPKAGYCRFLRYRVAFLFIIMSYGAKVSLTLKIILMSQENFDVKYRRNKNQQMNYSSSTLYNETASYCCYGYSRHQSTEFLDVVYKCQKLITKLNEKKYFLT